MDASKGYYFLIWPIFFQHFHFCFYFVLLFCHCRERQQHVEQKKKPVIALVARSGLNALTSNYVAQLVKC